VLTRNGIKHSPDRCRPSPWSTFVKAHWKVLAASHFVTVELWTGRGLVTHYVLFVISLSDRLVEIAGITARSDESRMYGTRPMDNEGVLNSGHSTEATPCEAFAAV
jgi:putative transposase